MLLNAKTSVRPAYENTIIGRYLLTFSVIFITSAISFIRSAVVAGNHRHSFNNWSENKIKVVLLQICIGARTREPPNQLSTFNFKVYGE